MNNIAQLWNTIHSTIINSSRQLPSTATIPRDHIDENLNGALDQAIKKDQDYFQVQINEMFLTNTRQWFNQIDPVVYVVSEFVFKGTQQAVPFIVGPGIFKKLGVPDEYNQGILLRNTNVSGLRPYRGGGLTLTVVLCQSNKNLLRPMLDVIENISGALDFSPALLPYSKVADVLMQSFQILYNSNGVTPLVGLRDSYGPLVKKPLLPGYYALIDAPNINEQNLWVVDRQLRTGSSLQAAKPFRSADYVLYSINTTVENARDDIDILPFYEKWERVKKEAATPIEDPDFKNAKVLMSNLYQEIILCPDLTDPQADILATTYRERMAAIHSQAVSIGNLGPAEVAAEETREAKARKQALDILDFSSTQDKPAGTTRNGQTPIPHA